MTVSLALQCKGVVILPHVGNRKNQKIILLRSNSHFDIVPRGAKWCLRSPCV